MPETVYGGGVDAVAVLLLFLVAMTASLLALVLRTTKMGGIGQPGIRAKKLEATWIALVFTVLAIFMLISVPWIPRVATSEVQPQQVVHVTAFQFGWLLDSSRIQADVPVLFIAVTKDVTHGFGVYSPDGFLLFQMQVVPGYENHFIYTFHTKGDYRIVCLEFCGYNHPKMIGAFTVS